MTNELMDDPVIKTLVVWGEAREDVRAAVLTSTRAATGGPTDEFSDYDVIYVVRDVRPYLNDAWLGDFGQVLNLYRDPVRKEFGCERFTRVTQYENGLKIDFSVCAAGWLEAVLEQPSLPAELDVGYAVLLDKDGLTAMLPPFTRTAYLPKPPTRAVFMEAVSNFFSNASYEAKYICRGDLFPMMGMQDQVRRGRLRQMLEWRVAAESGWKSPLGAYGRGLDVRLGPATLAELKSLYVGPGREANWESLFHAVALYEQAARDVAANLGFTFPEELFRRNLAYLRRVRAGYGAQ